MYINNRPVLVILLSFALLSTQLQAGPRSQKQAAPYFSPHSLVLLTGGAVLFGYAILKHLWSSSDYLKRYYSEDASNGWRVLEATAVLRFPHLLTDLMDQEELRENVSRPSVLILGAGIQPNGCGPETPFVHELAAIFPQSNMEIVDLDPRVDVAVKTGGYRKEFAQLWANRVVDNKDNFSRFNDKKGQEEGQRSRKQLKNLLSRIPLKLSEHADLNLKVHTTYFEVHRPDRYDYIIATKSLMYPLVSTVLTSSEKQNLIEKYLNALNQNGRLYVDFESLQLIEGALGREYFNSSEFKYDIIEHRTSYNKLSNCEENRKRGVGYEYAGCLMARGTRVSSTEDVVVITRRSDDGIIR